MKIVLASIAVVVAVVAEIISTQGAVVVGGGGDYLDTSGSGSRDYFASSPVRSLSCGQLTVL